MNVTENNRSDEVVALLKEIRDDQRAWIEGSNKSVEESQQVQAESVRLQAAMGQLYKKVILICGILALLIVAYLVYVFVFEPH